MTDEQKIGDALIKTLNLIMDSIERHGKRLKGRCPGCGEYLSGSLCVYSDSERRYLCTGPDNDGCTFCGEAVDTVCKDFICEECGWSAADPTAAQAQGDGEGVEYEICPTCSETPGRVHDDNDPRKAYVNCPDCGGTGMVPCKADGEGVTG